MGDSMDTDLLPELSGEMWVAATYLEEVAADLPTAESELDLIVASRLDETLSIVCEWVRSGSVPSWSECSGLSPALWCWWLQFGNLSVDMDGSLWCHRAPRVTNSQLVVPLSERRFIWHDYLFAGHLGVSRTVCRLLDRVYWPAFDRRSGRIWLAVRFVWPASLLVCGGLRWGMSPWVTGGIGWPWIFLICRLRLRREIAMRW